MEFKCEFYSSQIWPNGVKYTCQVVSFSIIEPNAKFSTFDGTHEEGKTNNDVEGFFIPIEQLKRFPKGLWITFPRLTSVQISCTIEEISREDLRGLFYLEYLKLSHNKLKSLPNDLFVETPNLQWILLNGNEIKRLSSKIFEPLHKKNLKCFSLCKNSTIDTHYEQGGKTTLEDVMEKIDLLCLPPIEKCLIKLFEPLIGHQNRFPKYEEYFVTGKFSDFTIKGCSKEYKVHKIVLAAQSSVFESIFNKDDGNDVKVLEKIKLISVDAFEDFLRYFYFGSIRCAENTMELFELAFEFGVATLKVECEEIFLRNIGEHNMLEILNLGQLHGSENLKKIAIARIKTSFPSIADNLIDAPEVVANLINAKRYLD